DLTGRDLGAVSGPPLGELGRREPGLIRRDDPVRQRAYAYDHEQLAKALLRAHQRVAEEEERQPLQLLSKATEDLQDSGRFWVEGLDQHDRDETKHPRRERRQPDPLAPSDDAQHRTEADRRRQHVANGGGGFAAADAELDRAVDHQQVDRQQRDGHLEPGAHDQADDHQRREDAAEHEREVGVRYPERQPEPDPDRDQPRQTNGGHVLEAPVADGRMTHPDGPGQPRVRDVHRPISLPGPFEAAKPNRSISLRETQFATTPRTGAEAVRASNSIRRWADASRVCPARATITMPSTSGSRGITSLTSSGEGASTST